MFSEVMWHFDIFYAALPHRDIEQLYGKREYFSFFLGSQVTIIRGTKLKGCGERRNLTPNEMIYVLLIFGFMC